MHVTKNEEGLRQCIEMFLYLFNMLYSMATIAVREVDEKVFRQFKSKAVSDGLPVGEALTLAMKSWLDVSRKRKSVLSLKPSDWGVGSEHSCEEIDKYLYGA